MRSSHYYIEIIERIDRVESLLRDGDVYLCRIPTKTGKNRHEIHVEYLTGTAAVLRGSEKELILDIPSRLVKKLKANYSLSEEVENNLYYGRPRFFSKITHRPS